MKTIVHELCMAVQSKVSGTYGLGWIHDAQVEAEEKGRSKCRRENGKHQRLGDTLS